MYEYLQSGRHIARPVDVERGYTTVEKIIAQNQMILESMVKTSISVGIDPVPVQPAEGVTSNLVCDLLNSLLKMAAENKKISEETKARGDTETYVALGRAFGFYYAAQAVRQIAIERSAIAEGEFEFKHWSDL